MILRVLVLAVCVAALSAYPAQNKQNSICVNNPCHNGGSCIRTPDGYACTCNIKFYGKLCQNACPCLNGGRCLESEGESAPSCLCPQHTHGDFCQLTWTQDALTDAASQGEHPDTVPLHAKQAWAQNPHLMKQLVHDQQKALTEWEKTADTHPVVNKKKNFEEKEEEETDDEPDFGPDESEDDETREEQEDEEGEKKEEMDDEIQAAKEIKAKKQW